MSIPYDVQKPPPRNGAGHAALVLGATAMLFLFIPVIGDFVTGAAAIGAVIAGYIGFDRAYRRQATNRGEAIGGALLGVLALMIMLVIFAASTGASAT